jgi:hypothetical protein
MGNGWEDNVLPEEGADNGLQVQEYFQSGKACIRLK